MAKMVAMVEMEATQLGALLVFLKGFSFFFAHTKLLMPRSVGSHSAPYTGSCDERNSLESRSDQCNVVPLFSSSLSVELSEFYGKVLQPLRTCSRTTVARCHLLRAS